MVYCYTDKKVRVVLKQLIQAMVGHRELSTTQRYIRLDATDLQEATASLEIDLEMRGEILHFVKDGRE